MVEFNDIIKAINIEPYYRDWQSDIVIYNADCRLILPKIPDRCIDLVLTDPPYGIGYKPDSYNPFSDFDAVNGDKEPFDPRFLLDYDNAILWGANNYTTFLPRGGWLCWDKRVIESADKMVGSPFELAWVKKREQANVFKIARIQHGGVVNADTIKGMGYDMRFHPTQKPIRLMTWCLTLFPNADIVLDPFLGSGTTAVACKVLGRKCIGIELEEKYCEIAKKRLAQGVLC